jgi:hypothetical protein
MREPEDVTRTSQNDDLNNQTVEENHESYPARVAAEIDAATSQGANDQNT